MELELQRETIQYFDLVCRTTLCQEETQEAIVPDACPDILRILDTRAQAGLTGKQPREGVATITGVVRAAVLYQPEGELGQVCRQEITVPFTCQAEGAGITAHSVIQAVPRVRWCEARMLNPRKVLLRADLVVEVWAYQRREMELCTSADGNKDQGVEQLADQEQMTLTIAVQEKPFTFDERLELGAMGQLEPELLGLWGQAEFQECKLVGSKLIFKGAVNVQALVCEGDQLRTVSQSLPFSQIMEMSCGGERCVCDVRLVLNEMQLQDGELEVEVLAQGVVRENRSVPYLKDLYSTLWDAELTRHPYPIKRAVEDCVHTLTLRELVETTTLVRGIACCWVELGDVTCRKDGNQAISSVDAHLRALYLDDGGELQSVHKTVPVEHRMENAGSANCCWCSVPREVFASASAGGLEFRFALDFHCLCQEEGQLTAILAAQLSQERSKRESDQPSIILRMAAPGECLWDLAKAYGTTTGEIMQANELDSPELPWGKMLLIPRLR